MASRRRATGSRGPSKRESRAAREAREVFERRSSAATLGWERKREREAAEFRRRSKAAKLGHKRREARKAIPKVAAADKAVKAKVRSVSKKVAASRGGDGAKKPRAAGTKKPKVINASVYSKAERKKDRAEIKRLRDELEALKAQAGVDTSDFVNIVPDEWARQDGSIALNRCRLRHTEDAPRIQAMLNEAYELEGEIGVKQVIRRLGKHYDDHGDWPDDDPMTEHEIWTLFFSP